MNLKIIFISVATLFALFWAFSQYLNEFQSELVSAYDNNKPANGHSWDEMICTTGLCVKNNKVGIGTDDPQNSLELGSGSTLKIATGAGAGKVLTSDANGVATWTTSTSGVSGSGSANKISKWSSGSAIGDSIIFDNGTNVGIGTSSPSQKLEVNGRGLFTQDVCNGAGACLSQINDFIGSQALVNNVHNYAACTSAGGTIVDTDVSFKQCRFNAASCPSGWTQYKSYSTTTNSCQDFGTACYNHKYPCYNRCSSGVVCSGYHNWGNAGIESTSGCFSNGQWCGQSTCMCCNPSSLTATRVQIGCY